MNKRLIVTSLFTCMLMAHTSYNQTSNPNNLVPEDSNTVQDRTIIDTAKIRLTTTKANRYSRYKDLQKEKDRRKKIREKYKKEKASNL